MAHLLVKLKLKRCLKMDWHQMELSNQKSNILRKEIQVEFTPKQSYKERNVMRIERGSKET